MSLDDETPTLHIDPNTIKTHYFHPRGHGKVHAGKEWAKAQQVTTTFTDVSLETMSLLSGVRLLDLIPTPQNRDTQRRAKLQQAPTDLERYGNAFMEGFFRGINAPANPETVEQVAEAALRRPYLDPYEATRGMFKQATTPKAPEAPWGTYLLDNVWRHYSKMPEPGYDPFGVTRSKLAELAASNPANLDGAAFLDGLIKGLNAKESTDE